jgi:hypothetical protein
MDVIGQNGNDGLHYEDQYYELDHSSECSWKKLKNRV